MTTTPPVAFDDPAVRAEWTRYRRTGRLVTAAAVLVFNLSAVLITQSEDRQRTREETGTRIPGKVIRASKAAVTVTYRIEDAPRTLRLSFPEDRYRPGDRVTVVISGVDPHDVSIVGETNERLVNITAWIANAVGLGAAVIGPGTILRARRQRRRLRAEPWRRYPIRYHEGSGYKGAAIPLLLIDDGTQEHLLVLAGMFVWRLPRLGLRGATEAEVVGNLQGYAVVRSVGSARVASAHPPRLQRTARRWRSWFDQP